MLVSFVFLISLLLFLLFTWIKKNKIIKNRSKRPSVISPKVLSNEVPLAFARPQQLMPCRELTKVYWGFNLRLASLHVGSTRQQRKQPLLLFEAETQKTGPCLLSAGQPVMFETKESRATRDSSGAGQTFSGYIEWCWKDRHSLFYHLQIV